MNIKNIIIVVEPASPTLKMVHDGQSVPNPKSIHQFANYELLADELKGQTPAKIEIFEGFLKSVSPSNFVLVYPRNKGLDFDRVWHECDSELQKVLSKRLVILNTFRAEAQKLLSQYPVLAVVEDTFDYKNWWQLEQRHPPRQGMYGLTAVAKEINAFLPWGDERERRTCYFRGDEFERLPALLIRYLEACERTFPKFSSEE
jgi:hypothetical protein